MSQFQPFCLVLRMEPSHTVGVTEMEVGEGYCPTMQCKKPQLVEATDIVDSYRTISVTDGVIHLWKYT